MLQLKNRIDSFYSTIFTARLARVCPKMLPFVGIRFHAKLVILRE